MSRSFAYRLGQFMLPASLLLILLTVVYFFGLPNIQANALGQDKEHHTERTELLDRQHGPVKLSTFLSLLEQARSKKPIFDFERSVGLSPKLTIYYQPQDETEAPNNFNQIFFNINSRDAYPGIKKVDTESLNEFGFQLLDETKGRYGFTCEIKKQAGTAYIDLPYQVLIGLVNHLNEK